MGAAKSQEMPKPHQAQNVKQALKKYKSKDGTGERRESEIKGSALSKMRSRKHGGEVA